MCFAIENFKDGVWVNGEKIKAIPGEHNPGDIVEINGTTYFVVEV